MGILLSSTSASRETSTTKSFCGCNRDKGRNEVHANEDITKHFPTFEIAQVSMRQWDWLDRASAIATDVSDEAILSEFVFSTVHFSVINFASPATEHVCSVPCLVSSFCRHHTIWVTLAELADSWLVIRLRDTHCTYPSCCPSRTFSLGKGGSFQGGRWWPVDDELMLS